MPFTIELTESPTTDELAALGAGLTAHAVETLGRPGFQKVAFLVRSTEGQITAGLSGMINWNWAFIQNLWLSEALRRKGLGTRLLQRFEDYAREHGSQQIHLDTFGFQAPGFYDKHGYTCFATLDDYPVGYQRFFYKKTL